MVVRMVPRAVEIDRATLHHDIGIENRKPELLGNARRHRVVVIVRRILSPPGVELPIDDPHRAAFLHESRSMIAAPALVGLDVIEMNIAKRAAVGFKLLPHNPLVVAVGDIDADFFPRRDFREDPGEVFGDGVIFVREGDSFRPGPTKPGGLVGGPFGGESVAQRGRGLFQDFQLIHDLGDLSPAGIRGFRRQAFDSRDVLEGKRVVAFCNRLSRRFSNEDQKRIPQKSCFVWVTYQEFLSISDVNAERNKRQLIHCRLKLLLYGNSKSLPLRNAIGRGFDVFAYKPPGHIPIRINPPIAQEGPMRAAELHLLQIAIRDENRLLVHRRLRDDLSIGRGHERLAPEFNSILADGLPGCVKNFLHADAIGRADKTSVGYGVAALDQLPAFVLGFAKFLSFAGMPADGGGVEQNLRP